MSSWTEFPKYIPHRLDWNGCDARCKLSAHTADWFQCRQRQCQWPQTKARRFACGLGESRGASDAILKLVRFCPALRVTRRVNDSTLNCVAFPSSSNSSASLPMNHNRCGAMQGVATAAICAEQVHFVIAMSWSNRDLARHLHREHFKCAGGIKRCSVLC